MKTAFSILFLLLSIKSFCQDIDKRVLDSAYSFFKNKDYIASAKYFEKAATSTKYNTIGVRYNAACAWARANMPDKAFEQLNSVVTDFKYDKLNPLSKDADLVSLHDDPRWHKLIMRINENQLKNSNTIDTQLKLRLEKVYAEDKKYRIMIDSIANKYGWESNEMKSLMAAMEYQDSINFLIVQNILDNRGWVGSKVVGSRGTTAIFLVIQHSSLDVQKRYLPLLQESAKSDADNRYNMAYLEDRIRVKEKRSQLYGTQYFRDTSSQKLTFYPIEDEINVNKRRISLGLNTIEEYARDCGFEYSSIK